MVVTATIAPVNASTIRLRVTGGAHAGTWQVRETRSLCGDGYSRPGEWSVRYAVRPLGSDSLASLQLFVPDAHRVAAGAQEFGLSIVFGPVVRPTVQYDVETRVASRRRRGSGSVTIVDRGPTATVTFDAKTADGVALRGVIDCGAVDRAPAP